MSRLNIIYSIIICFAFMVACGNDSHKTRDQKPVIAVSILPQKYFIERIGGDRVSVMVIAGEGQNPHSYEPSPAQMVSLSKAGAWVLSGVDFEIALKRKVTSRYPSIIIKDGTMGVRFRKMEHHSHEDKKEHAGEAHETNIDRHTWLGREPAKIMAGHILNVLIKTDPEGESIYKSNYQKLISDIDSVFSDLKKKLIPLSGKKIFVFHPAFGYFFDEFGLKQEAVETGGKEPTAKTLTALINKAKSEKPLVIFVQAQFPVNAAKTVADSVGAEVIKLDPLSPDWLENIKNMGAVLEKSLNRK